MYNTKIITIFTVNYLVDPVGLGIGLIEKKITHQKND